MNWHLDNLDADLQPEFAAIGGCQWGFNKPGAFVWVRVFPNGRLYVQADVKFTQLSVETVAERVHAKTRSLGIQKLRITYADPKIFPKADDDQAQVEPIAQVFGRAKLPMLAVHGERTAGWQRFHDYLREAPDGKPWLVVSPACQALIRTLPTLIQKKTDPDDCEGLDYAANALRFVLMARPMPSALRKPIPKFAEMTVGWLKQRGQKTPGLLAPRNVRLGAR